MNYQNINQVTKQIIGLAIKVHKTLGPGFVEKIYQRALYLEFKRNALQFEREKKISIYYNKALLGYEKVDFVIDNKVIVEVKCVHEINDIHKAQILSYLKAANTEIGLIINFAKPVIEVKRLINSAPQSNSAILRFQEKYSRVNFNKKNATTEAQKNLETQKSYG